MFCLIIQNLHLNLSCLKAGSLFLFRYFESLKEFYAALLFLKYCQQKSITCLM